MWIEKGLNCLCNLFLILIIIRYMGIFFKRKKNKKVLLFILESGLFYLIVKVAYISYK